ncbi:peptidoglycan DD-metalloendopeptidase family protein [Pantanalinema rosaneae CENA516]|uniref:peptidoglycan DD-metalloendopeptidase family protein n=1 Tax=Pantanalinema rosaneae TaxID=1620701 RepID=UPI003D6F9F5E
MTTVQPKQALSESSRRPCKSAAMIGLALSMGAYSLPLPGQTDAAMATEPMTGESAATAPTAFETATLSSDTSASQAASDDPLLVAASPAALSSPTTVAGIRHTVQEGQTLWQLAKLYGVDAGLIASSNSIATDTTLRVGQVLVIPTDNRVAQAAPAAADVAPRYYGLVGGSPSTSTTIATLPTGNSAASSDTAFKAKQDAALDNLKQKRESLRTGLLGMQAEAPAAVAPTTTLPDSTASAPVSTPSVLPVSPQPEVVAASPVKQETVLATPPLQSDAEPSTPVVSQPVPSPVDVAALPSSLTYQVNRGDTLAAIARAHGVSTSQLVAANRLSNPNHIEVAQVLVIPRRGVVSDSVPSLLTPPNPSELQGTQAEFKGTLAAVPTQTTSATSSPNFNRSGTPSEVTQVAIAPTSNQVATPTDTSGGRSNHVDHLRQEIHRLRDKYQGQGGQVQASAAKPQLAAAATPFSRSDRLANLKRVNPEFNPTAYSANLRAEVQQLRERMRPTQTIAARVSPPTTVKSTAPTTPVLTPQPSAARTAPATPVLTPQPSAARTAPANPVPASQPQVVATAPIGAEKYAPIVSAPIGKTVSPDLPPLSPSDAYLPGSSGQFNGYMWPTKGVLTSGYGWRWGRMHKGIDIAANVGTPIVAAASGVVTFAGWNSGGYGYLVEITHPDGSLTLYAHNNRILVQQGQQVEQGQQISEMGSTGYSTGPHLHFEVHPAGKGAVNPMAFLPSSRS